MEGEGGVQRHDATESIIVASKVASKISAEGKSHTHARTRAHTHTQTKHGDATTAAAAAIVFIIIFQPAAAMLHNCEGGRKGGESGMAAASHRVGGRSPIARIVSKRVRSGFLFIAAKPI